MKNLLLIGTIGLLSTGLFANEKGNGGDAVVCRDAKDKIISAELLDYYESRRFRGTSRSSKLPKNVSSYKDYVNKVLNEIDRFDPSRVESLKTTTNLLLKAARNYDNSGTLITDQVVFTQDYLQNISDSNHLAFPKNCEVEQVAIRVAKIFEDDPSFLIQEEIWNSLPNLSKAGLILHEAIYKEAADNNRHSTSVFTRYFNQKVSSVNFKNFNFVDYLNLLYKIKFKKIKHRNYILSTEVKEHSQTGFYRSKNTNYRSLNPVIVFDTNGNINPDLIRLANPRDIYFSLESKGYSSIDIIVKIDGKVICSSDSISIKEFELEDSRGKTFYTHECQSELLTGSYNFEVTISSNSKYNLTNFWYLRPQAKSELGTLDAYKLKMEKNKTYTYSGAVTVE